MLRSTDSSTTDLIHQIEKILINLLDHSAPKLPRNEINTQLDALNTRFNAIPKSSRTAEWYDYLLYVHAIDTLIDEESSKIIEDYIIKEFEEKPSHLNTAINGVVAYISCLAGRLVRNLSACHGATAKEYCLYSSESTMLLEKLQRAVNGLPEHEQLFSLYPNPSILRSLTICSLPRPYLQLMTFHHSLGDSASLLALAEKMLTLCLAESPTLFFNIHNARGWLKTYYVLMSEANNRTPILSKLFNFASQLFNPDVDILLRDLLSTSHDFASNVSPTQLNLYKQLILIFKIIAYDEKSGAFDCVETKPDQYLIPNTTFRALMRLPAARKKVIDRQKELELNRVELTHLNSHPQLMIAHQLELQALRKQIAEIKKQLDNATNPAERKQVRRRNSTIW